MYDLTGKKVTGTYLDVEVAGVVKATHVNYGKDISHHIVLNKDVDFGFGVSRTAGEIVIVSNNDLIAVN